MIPEPLLLAVLALLGGAVALDGTAVGQFMLSRPLAAATLGGLAAGDPVAGVVAGLVLEALHLAVLPVGAATYPESGPAGIAAGAAFALASESYPALMAVILLALGWEWVGGKTVNRLRQFNVRFDGVGPEGIEPGTLARRHAAAVALDFARGAVLTLLAVLLFGWLLEAVPWGRVPARWAELVLGLVATAALASALRLFGRGRWPWFAAGAGLGVVWLVAA